MTPKQWREALRALDMMTGEVAALLGRDKTTVRRWIRGARRTPPEAEKLIDLLVAGKIKPADLRR
jgi:DNA-binding transcriptional regulator YdaS (Cro superfamily)